MNIEDKKIAILFITKNGKELGLKIKRKISTAYLYYVKKDVVKEADGVIYVNRKLKEFVPEIFGEYDYIIFIMACGIVVRTIAPLIENKFNFLAIISSDDLSLTSVAVVITGFEFNKLLIYKVISFAPPICPLSKLIMFFPFSSLTKIAGSLNLFRSEERRVGKECTG